MLYNRQEFILRSPLGEVTLHVDPMGADDTETSVGRSEKTYGIFTTVANNLKFIGDTKDWLELNYDLYGVNAQVELTKKLKHPKTDEWFIPKGFPGYLDFTTRKIEENKFTVDFIEGGLKELLETQSREKFELDRLESISGVPINPLATDVITIEGRDIYLLSKFQERTGTFTTYSGRYSSGNEDRYSFHPLPITLVANSDNLNLSDPMESYGTEERYLLTIGNMFFSTADRDRGLVKFNGSASFRIDSNDGNRVNSFLMKFVVKKFTSDPDGNNIVFVENIFEQSMGDPVTGQEFTVNINLELSPLENESYAMGFDMVGRYGGGVPAQDGWNNYTFMDLEADFSWAEDSFFARSNAQFMTAYEVGQRLTEIYTGKRKFISTLLNQGSWKDLGFTCGGWLRNLQKKVDVTDAQGIVLRTDLEPWSITFSWEDFFKSIHATQPVGFGIVTKGAKQFLALENIRYFFQPYVTIRIGEVSNVKRSTAKEFVFTSITTGYVKGGNYEQPLGLDEYNVQTTWTSPIVRGGERKYEVLGPSRADSYGVEQARRLPFDIYPDEDTPFDKDNFIIDAKFATRQYRVNYYDIPKWPEHFEILPTGVYSPETAFNLRLSPVNNLHRHATWFNSAIRKYPNEELLHANSEGNSELQTKPIGENLRKENDEVPVSELSNPIFEPEWIEFESGANQSIIDMIQGVTEIEGEMINNYYGLVEYVADGKKERGYLFTAKIKNTINWKILRSYGF